MPGPCSSQRGDAGFRPIFLVTIVALGGGLHVSGAGSTASTDSTPLSAWSIEALDQAWSISGVRADSDISGIAAWDKGNGLLCSDEGAAIQPVTIDLRNRTIRAGAPIALVPPGPGIELDLEGAAASRTDAAYYVTGSHGAGKKRGDYQPSRMTVFRVPVDSATGLVRPEGLQKASLAPWIETNPVLRDSFRRPLQLNGLNIEGLASKDGRLWFGLRAPNTGGDAFVIETTPGSLFRGEARSLTLHRLPLGDGQGIRELAAIQEGFLVLVGNASAEPTKRQPRSLATDRDRNFRLVCWTPDAGPAVRDLGKISHPVAKAEGLLVLEEKPCHIDLLVVFDGAPAGDPRAFRINKCSAVDAR